MMMIFDTDNKINFIDENNVILGYDLNQNCCESAYWFISDKQETEPQEESKVDCDPDLKGFYFDKSFFSIVNETDSDHGTMVVFRIVNGEKEKFIHLVNVHNGYYNHGFEMKIKEEILKEGYI